MDPSLRGPGGADPEYEDLPASTGSPRGFWLHVAVALFLGAAGLFIAARGSGGGADFESDFWRIALGATGAFYTFIFIRALYRAQTAYRPRFDRDTHRRSAMWGKLHAVLGLWFVLLAVVPPLGDATIELEPWLKVGYGIGGGWTLITGLLAQWNPTRFVQSQRVEAGEGRPARAFILRANDTGVFINERPQVKIDFRIEIEGETPHEASDKIVMQQSKLALLIPGSSVAAIVDRINPDVFHLNWDDWRGPPTTTG